MKRCDVCGNQYDKMLEITYDGQTRAFDSFECAIQALAPTCAACDVRILGHGVEAGNRFFCSAHCANEAGFRQAVDHVRTA